MAIQNSRLARLGRTLVVGVLGGLLGLGGSSTQAATLEESERLLQQARAALEAKPKDVELNWRFAAACFNRAEFAHQSSERARLAEQGIAAARESVRMESNCVQGRYYLAVNLGQLARTRTLSALGIVAEMEKQFLAAIAIDPRFRHAAPVRSLGMLYLDAPGWPASVGSRSKARVQLQKAVELAPDYPENWLTLMEAEIKWGDRKKVQTQLVDIDRRLEQAKAAWIAEEGEASWKSLLERVEKVRAQAAAASPPAQGSAKR